MEADGRLSGKVPIVALTANVSNDSELECSMFRSYLLSFKIYWLVQFELECNTS